MRRNKKPRAGIKWFNSDVATVVKMDKTGSVLLPKHVRDRLQLAPGNTLELKIKGNYVVLSPVRNPIGFHKEMGIWVYRSGKPANTSVLKLIEANRTEGRRNCTP